MNDLYIPSTSAGKTWRAYIYKPQGRAAYASAIEGVASGSSFTFELYGSSKTARVNLPGRATDKAKRAAMLELVRALELHGFITAADAAIARAEIAGAEKIGA